MKNQTKKDLYDKMLAENKNDANQNVNKNENKQNVSKENTTSANNAVFSKNSIKELVFKNFLSIELMVLSLFLFLLAFLPVIKVVFNGSTEVVINMYQMFGWLFKAQSISTNFVVLSVLALFYFIFSLSFAVISVIFYLKKPNDKKQFLISFITQLVFILLVITIVSVSVVAIKQASVISLAFLLPSPTVFFANLNITSDILVLLLLTIVLFISVILNNFKNKLFNS